jgi:chemotaxis protein methyltransferase CheR
MHSTVKHFMTPEEFRLIREFIEEKFGLMIDESKEGYLTREIGHRLTKLRLTSFSDYYTYIKYAPANVTEYRNLISLITNNETVFFREESQLRVYADKILPELKNRKVAVGTKKIRIVSAGCSSGEEVYTLAMLLMESGHFIWDWDVQIIGIDLDSEALKKAERGIYSGRAFQATPDYFLDRYFRKCTEGFAVRDILRRITTFHEGNLLELEKSLSDNTIDILFCRNVLIYFNDDTIKRVVESFAKILTKTGLLFLGHSESLARITEHYLALRYPGTIIYENRK